MSIRGILKYKKESCLTFQKLLTRFNNLPISLFSDKCKKGIPNSLTRMTDHQLDQGRTCSFVSEEVIAKGKWLGLNKVTYIDPTGKERVWEAACRTTRRPEAASDAVCSIPILKRLLHYDSIILVKQYRPPMKAYTVEFPAGLLDPDEGPETCALRELKEETGYTGVAKHTSPATALDPGLSNTSVKFVTVEIDGDLPENESHIQKSATLPETLHPKPCNTGQCYKVVYEGEFIEVLTVPLDEMLSKVNELAAEGLVIDSRVYSYAVAREQQKNHKPTI